MGPGQSHLLAPFIHFTKDLLSAYVPGTGVPVINETDKMPALWRLTGRKQVNKHASKVTTDYKKH